MRLRHYAWLAVTALLFAAPAAARANETGGGDAGAEAPAEPERSPIELARQATDQVFEVLRDPELQGDEHAQERADRVRAIVDRHFDWRAMAQRSLGRHWRDRTEEERKEFIDLYAELVERTYMSTIERNRDAEIRYEGEDIRDGRATVKTVAIAKRSKVVPIAYRMREVTIGEGEDAKKVWRVYDVIIEGVSMVSSYRGQFNDLIVGGSYEKMIQRLREKVASDD